MTTPLVSILIPSFKPRHFEIALTSALAQTYAEKEIIVSDDCPTDEIERICSQYPHVRYSRNPERGPNRNLLRLTALARGEYLKYLMDDDVLHPLCLTRMVEAFGADSTITLVFSARDLIDENSRIVGQRRSIQPKTPVSRMSGATLRRHCLINTVNVIGEFTTVMFRKADVLQSDGRPLYVSYRGEPVVGLTDIATFLQLCEKGDAIYFSEPLSYFRIHHEANSSNQASAGVRNGFVEWARLARQVWDDPAFTPEDIRACLLGTRRKLATRLNQFPELAAELEMLDNLLLDLEPGASQPG